MAAIAMERTEMSRAQKVDELHRLIGRVKAEFRGNHVSVKEVARKIEGLRHPMRRIHRVPEGWFKLRAQTFKNALRNEGLSGVIGHLLRGEPMVPKANAEKELDAVGHEVQVIIDLAERAKELRLSTLERHDTEGQPPEPAA